MIRFNKKCYDRRKFLDNGINHVDLFYEDGELTRQARVGVGARARARAGALPLHALERAGPAGVGVSDARVREEALQARLVGVRVQVKVKV